jgi:hypothetical protein
MKKVLLLLVLLISFFFVNVKVNALGFNATKKFDNVEINYLEGQSDSASCDGIITQEGLDIIREVLGWIRILAPILLGLLIAVDLGNAVISSDNDALSKATKKIVPRIIGTVLLFFVPTIVRLVLGLDGVKDAIVIPDDPLCHITDSRVINKEISM